MQHKARNNIKTNNFQIFKTLDINKFEFVSDFDIRYSNLGNFVIQIYA